MSTPTDNTVPLRIVLADDLGLVRTALARLVRTFPGMEIVAEVEDGCRLLEALAAHPVDVAIIDAAMRQPNGFDATVDIARAHPDVRVLILSMYTGPEYVQRAREAGAHGFVAKDAATSRFEDAIRRVARGGGFVDVPAVGEACDAPPPGEPGEIHLTRRQREVLQLVVEGYRTKDIARRLGVSVKTVETHRADLMRRLGVGNMAALVREALRLDLLPPHA